MDEVLKVPEDGARVSEESHQPLLLDDTLDEGWPEELTLGEEGRMRVKTRSRATSACRMSLAIGSLALLVLLAVLHPALREFIPAIPSLRGPTKALLVERNPNVTFADYLETQFPDKKELVLWTFATGSYVQAMRNWDGRRAELGMNGTVVIVCLDVECLDKLEQVGGLRGYGGYLIEYVGLSPPSRRRSLDLEKRGAERGHYMAYCKFKGMFLTLATSLQKIQQLMRSRH